MDSRGKAGRWQCVGPGCGGALLALWLCAPATAGASGEEAPSADEAAPPAPAGTQAATPAAPNGSAYRGPLTLQGKTHYYLRSTYGPGALARSALSAALGQARDTQPEWGQGFEGYGRRYASRFGQHAVRRTIMYGVGAMLHEDPRYFRSDRTGFLPRVADSARNVLIVRRDDGSRAPAYGRVVGAFGGGLISRTWHPEGERTVGRGFRSGAVTLGYDAALRIFHEFWPDIRRALRH